MLPPEVAIITIQELLLVLSKKYYASGEIVVEFITPENKEINTRIEITLKKDKDLFQLGKKYKVTFIQEG